MTRSLLCWKVYAFRFEVREGKPLPYKFQTKQSSLQNSNYRELWKSNFFFNQQSISLWGIPFIHGAAKTWLKPVSMINNIRKKKHIFRHNCTKTLESLLIHQFSPVVCICYLSVTFLRKKCLFSLCSSCHPPNPLKNIGFAQMLKWNAEKNAEMKC